MYGNPLSGYVLSVLMLGAALALFMDFRWVGRLRIDWKYKMSLTPPDKTRCQAEMLSGSFMTLGPRHLERCTNRPTVIATETNPGEDGQKGSMSLCENCLKIFKQKFPKGYATFSKIST